MRSAAMPPMKLVMTFLALAGLLLGSGCRAESVAEAVNAPATNSQLPRLVDVGADKCIPCIKMAPILDQLREDFRGRMEVVFVDAWKQREEAAKYGIRMIPTQVFYAADGRELFRHVGFFGREEILAKWRDLGYDFGRDNP